MIKFLKAQAASLTATAVDFIVTVVLVELFSVWYLLATVIGTISGGIVNFIMGRKWVFVATIDKMHHQAIRYVLVWTGNLLLVSLGVYLLTHYGKISYVISKATVSILVGFTYNFLLQKKFVFKS